MFRDVFVFSGTGAEDENDKKLFFSSKTKFIIFFLSFKDENSFFSFLPKTWFSKNFRIGQLLLAGRRLGSEVVALALATLGTGFESRRPKLADGD